jgi:hypothetical protein
MEGKTFRLGEYRITDFGTGLIRWETHHDLGGQRSGRCHRLREVLVLGEFEQEQSGYLKGEFLDRLKGLPPWTRTRYFCLASHLHVVGTGRRPDKDLLAGIGYQGIHQESVSKRAGDKKKGTFRLGRYRITFASDNEVFWETLGDGNKIVTGNCTLESGILIMGPRQGIQGEQNKREYIQQLHRLPLWNRTCVWGLQDVLQLCQVPAKPKIHYFSQRLPPTPKREPFIKKTTTKEKFGFDKQPEKIQRNRIKDWKLSLPAFPWSWRPKRPNFPRVCSFFSFGVKLPSLPGNFFRWSRLKKPANPSIVKVAKGKNWMIWVSLLLVGLLLVFLVTTLYLANKKGHGHYHSREHNYRSKDH